MERRRGEEGRRGEETRREGRNSEGERRWGIRWKNTIKKKLMGKSRTKMMIELNVEGELALEMVRARQMIKGSMMM